MTYDSQQPAVQACSQFRARIRSAWNDLYYSDRSPKDDRDSGLTLRKLFAIVWVIAVLTVTWQFDLASMLLVGVPVGLLGYSLLAHGKCHPGLFVAYLLWGAVGYYCCYLSPYSKTRIKDFPPSASNLYAEGDWFCERVRFFASVDDCRLTAEKLVVEDRRYFSKVQPNPRPINKKLG